MFAGLVIAFDVVLILAWIITLAVLMSSLENLKATTPLLKGMIIATIVVIVLNILADKI